MANEQLVDWIKEQQTVGYHPQQLRDFLLKEGYAQQDVDESILAVNPAARVSVSKKAVINKSDIGHIAIAVTGAIATVSGIIMLI